jgi:excisionase family DNA binding protein
MREISYTHTYERMSQMTDTIKMTITCPIMLTINEAAKLVQGLTAFRIRKMCISGELPCIKAGKKYLINQEVLFRILRSEQIDS